MSAVDSGAIARAKFKVIVDYAFATTSLILPSILDRLGVTAVTLNAAIEERKVTIPAEEFEMGMQQLGLICSPLQADVGVRFDVGGEKIFLCDDRGNVLSGTTALAVMAILSLRSHNGGVIAVTANQPHIFERIAQEYGGSVVRTKVDPSALMAAACSSDVVLAGDGTGNYIIPALQPAIDGMMAFAKLLEYLAVHHTRLSEVVHLVPPYFTASRSVPCPWDAKGKVMRRLNEQYKEFRSEQIDGIKIESVGEWALIIPDPDRPICRVICEADSAERVQQLVQEYSHIVEELQRQ